MTRKFLFTSFLFLTGACGGSDNDPKTPSTTEVAAPDEKGEENIQMSAGSPAAPKPAPTAEPAKPAAPAPAPTPAPAPAPAPTPAPALK